MSDLSKLTVLFVEDEQDIRDALEGAIGDEFTKFIVARDGEDGLKKFKKYKPDIVIADIMMPVMDGLMMSKQIKHLSRQTPIVILSAFSEKERLLVCKEVKGRLKTEGGIAETQAFSKDGLAEAIL